MPADILKSYCISLTNESQISKLEETYSKLGIIYEKNIVKDSNPLASVGYDFSKKDITKYLELYSELIHGSIKDPAYLSESLISKLSEHNFLIHNYAGDFSGGKYDMTKGLDYIALKMIPNLKNDKIDAFMTLKNYDKYQIYKINK
jgi:hypothetical protein